MLICTVVAELLTVVLMALEDIRSSVVLLLEVILAVAIILETTKVDPLLDQVVLTGWFRSYLGPEGKHGMVVVWEFK